jgi:hypothetical protein
LISLFKLKWVSSRQLATSWNVIPLLTKFMKMPFHFKTAFNFNHRIKVIQLCWMKDFRIKWDGFCNVSKKCFGNQKFSELESTIETVLCILDVKIVNTAQTHLRSFECIPSTFKSLHDGPRSRWVQPQANRQNIFFFLSLFKI